MLGRFYVLCHAGHYHTVYLVTARISLRLAFTIRETSFMEKGMRLKFNEKPFFLRRGAIK